MSALFRTAESGLVISSDKSDEQFRVLTEMIERTLAPTSRRRTRLFLPYRGDAIPA